MLTMPGYNIKDDFDGVLKEFDEVVGLDKLKVIHVNDSKIYKVQVRIGMRISVLVRLVLKH